MNLVYKISILISLIFFNSCKESDTSNIKNTESPKSILVEINYNIETLGLIYCLADSELVYSDFSESAHLLKYELGKFKKYRSHPAVLKMKELINNGIFESSLVTIGLYYTNFPEFRKVYNNEIEHHYSEKNKKDLSDFFELAKLFYIDADLNQYFEEQKALYTKITSEVKSVLPKPKYIQTLETFYGTSMLGYSIVPSVFIPNFFNFGTKIKTGDGILNYYVLGATYDIEIDHHINLNNNIGYNDSNYIHSTGIHEFGHTFMRFIDKPANEERINSIAYLNTQALRDTLYPQGYGTWKGVFEEHLVRACEIIIAEKIGNKKQKEALFNNYVKERGFKYIPLILETISEYENHRQKYKTFEDFFPRIIDDLKTKYPPVN